MSRGDLEGLLGLIELKNFPVPVRARAREGLGGSVILLELGVRDRDTGEPTTFGLSVACDLSRLPEAERLDFLARCVRQALRDALAHEVDEALHVAGVRAFDPHRGE